MEIPAVIKDHPAMTAAVVIGGAGLLYLMSSSGGGSSSATSAQSSDAAMMNAAMQYQAQNAQVQAQANAQSLAAQTQLSITNSNNSTALQTAQLSAAVQENTNSLQSQVQMAQIQAGLTSNTNATQVQMQSLADQLSATQDTNQTTLGLATVSANENMAIANTNAQTQQVISGIAGSVAINQTNAVVQIAKINADASKTNGLFSMLGSIIAPFSSNPSAGGIATTGAMMML